MQQTRSIRFLDKNFDKDTFQPLPKQEVVSSNDTNQSNDEMVPWGAFSSEIIFWMILVALTVLFFLFVLKPDFLKACDEDEDIDYKNLILWTIVISLIIWVILVIFKKSK